MRANLLHTPPFQIRFSVKVPQRIKGPLGYPNCSTHILALYGGSSRWLKVCCAPYFFLLIFGVCVCVWICSSSFSLILIFHLHFRIKTNWMVFDCCKGYSFIFINLFSCDSLQFDLNHKEIWIGEIYNTPNRLSMFPW